MLKDYSFLGMTDFREDPVPYLTSCLEEFVCLLRTLFMFMRLPTEALQKNWKNPVINITTDCKS